MSFLLDTHIFLWYINTDARLASAFIEGIERLEHQVYLSVASIWEMIVKAKLGKLAIPSPYYPFIITSLQTHQIDILPLHHGEMRRLELLPGIHQDPFDRILICQSLEYDLTLLTDDATILKYPIKFLKA